MHSAYPFTTEARLVMFLTAIILATISILFKKSFNSDSRIIGSVIRAISISLWVLGFFAWVESYYVTSTSSHSDIKTRIQSLNDIESSLLTLHQYVIVQRKNLNDLEENVSSLKSEKSKLSSLVETDRKSIESILSIIDEKNDAAFWENILIGFSVGVLSSMAATIICKKFPFSQKK